MRNLILQMHISADGYVGRAGDGPDWVREAQGYSCGIVVIRYSPRGRASEKAKV